MTTRNRGGKPRILNVSFKIQLGSDFQEKCMISVIKDIINSLGDAIGEEHKDNQLIPGSVKLEIEKK